MGGRGTSLAEALRGRRIRTSLMKITSLVDIIMSLNDDMMIYMGYGERSILACTGRGGLPIPFPECHIRALPELTSLAWREISPGPGLEAQQEPTRIPIRHETQVAFGEQSKYY